MSDTPNPWEVRTLPGDVHLEMWGGDVPALVMAQGENRIRVELAHVKGVVAGLVDAAAELAEATVNGRVILAEALGADWEWMGDGEFDEAEQGDAG